ncbi:MAG: YiiX/YebB-like N1pC/P60 family cysteine hydrolase [Pseudomonadota bacterium]
MAASDLRSLARAVEGLIQAAAQLTADAPTGQELAAVIQRGEFRPLENEAIGYWFARYLTIRESLWSVIDEGREMLDGLAMSDDDQRLRVFLVGYAAACILVGIDRVMLFDVAEHSIVQRKLNEAFQELRIPRKQYTRIFEAFIREKSAWSLLSAMKFARQNRRRLTALASDPVTGDIARRLPELETSLDPSKRQYFKGAWAFVSHKWRRRGVVSANNVLSGVVEGVGRLASDIHLSNTKQVTEDIRQSVGQFLKPGDITVTRHATAVTNLFMPGFWPHAAFYVGTPAQRDALGVEVPAEKAPLWSADVCVLEALKDGVRFRPLSETLAVDCFVVLRPTLPADVVRQAIERGIVHEGKLYNFDFDFFSSDRLVCTEVIYRSYDGLGGVKFPLVERAGRKTLSAENLLEFSLEHESFEPVAIFGVEGCEKNLVTDDRVRDLLKASFRTH